MKNNITTKLHEILHVNQIDSLNFEGYTKGVFKSRLYGGQLIAQSTNAASRTVNSPRRLHSFHAYFLSSGNPDIPIHYQVEPVRDGRSFSMRKVTASQQDKILFICTLSFHIPEDSFNHQTATMPEVPEPESIETTQQFNARMKAKYPDKFEDFHSQLFRDWEYREVLNHDAFNPGIHAPVRSTWFRYKHRVADEALLNQTLLIFFSDRSFLTTAYPAHGVTVYDGTVMSTSLDHAMWLHQGCNVNEWMLYQTESHWAGKGRSLNTGKLYKQDGSLIASTTQEGLLRKITP